MLAVINPTGAAINVTSINPTVRTPSGVAASANIVGPFASTTTSVPQVGGSQFNVQVPANSTVNFPFQISFFGTALAGSGPATPTPVFSVGCDCYGSDAATFSAPPLTVSLNRPNFGPPPGVPPNKAPVVPGGLDFSTPANSGLIL
jgi:hypothetical protein